MNTLNFGSPPQPKSFKVEQPKPVVPDVTLMFDSDDSLVWKAAVVNSKPSRNLEEANCLPFPEGKENEDWHKKYDLKKTTEEKQENYVGNSPLREDKRKNFFYNPVIYKSGFQANIATKKPEAMSCCDLNSGNMLTKTIIPEIYTSKEPDQKGKNMLYYSKLDSTLSCGHNMNHCCNNSNTIPMMKNKYSDHTDDIEILNVNKKHLLSMPFNQNTMPIEGSPKIKIDKHVLKILEEQKMQIMCLHDILKKVLANQIKEQSNTKPIISDSHSCCDPNLKRTKIAIVQTSFLEEGPQTKTVATNTDITMDDISKLLEVEQRFNQLDQAQNINIETNSKMNETTCRRKEDEIRNINDKEESYFLPNIRTVHEGLSPEPTMHINIPEYRDDFAVEKFDRIDNDLHNGELAVGCDDVQRKAIYEEVLINIQHILQAKDNTEPCQDMVFENKPRPRDDKTGQIEKQLENYGISFLDPEIFQDKIESPFNALMMHGIPSMISMYQGNMALQYQRKAFIPTSHGSLTSGSKRYARNTAMRRVPHIYNEDHSLATGHFLGKFGLQK